MAATQASSFTPAERFQMAALFAAAIITNIAYTVLIPFVPELEARFGMGAYEIGGVFAGFALTKSLFQPVGGMLADRMEAKHVASGGLMFGALATLAIGFADAGWQVITLRLAWGIAEGVTIPALFRLCFTISPGSRERQGRIVGWFGSAEVLGMAAGPALVGALDGWLAYRGFFCLAAGITTVGACIIALGMTSSRQLTQSQEVSDALQSPRPLFRSVVAIVLVFGIADLVNNLLYAALEPALPLYVAVRYPDTNTVQLISGLFFLGLLMFSGVSLWTGFFLERLGLPRLMFIAFAIATVGLTIQGLANNNLILGLGFLAFMVSQPLVYIATRAAIGSSSSSRQGRAFGYFGLISDVGWIIGPLIGAPLIKLLGNGLFFGLALLSLLVACAALALLLWSRRKANDDFRSGRGQGAAAPRSCQTSRNEVSLAGPSGHFS